MKRIWALSLIVPVFIVAMEQEKLQAPQPPSGRAALVLAVSDDTTVPAILRPLTERAKEKKKKESSIPISIIKLAATQKFEPYDRLLSCAEAAAHCIIPSFFTDQRFGTTVLVIPHYQDGTSYLVEPIQVLEDVIDLADYTQKAGAREPEAFAFAHVPFFHLTKDQYHCSSKQAITAWPAHLKACMNPVRWQMLKQFICMNDEQFEKYVDQLKQRHANAEKSKEKKEIQSQIARSFALFEYLKNIKDGKLQSYLEGRPPLSCQERCTTINDYCRKRIKKNDRTSHLCSCPYLVQNMK